MLIHGIGPGAGERRAAQRSRACTASSAAPEVIDGPRSERIRVTVAGLGVF